MVTAMTKILLVEDDPVLRGLMRSSLEHAGHEVVAVSSARDALRCRAAGVVTDLIITDIDQQNLSSIDYADALIGHAGDVPVLGIVQRPADDDAPIPTHRGGPLGVTYMLAEPFSARTFCDTVTRLLGASTRPSTLEASA
jgi:CheY-like chemotaxis protein